MSQELKCGQVMGNFALTSYKYLLTRRYELAKVQKAKEIPSVKILDAAMVPTKKSFPSRTPWWSWEHFLPCFW
jgi:hypothetical protein